MQTLQLIHGPVRRESRTNPCGPWGAVEGEISNGRIVSEFPMRSPSAIKWNEAGWPCGAGEFFKGLPIEARRDLEFLATHFQHPAAMVLIREEQEPSSILFLLEGEVNISMNSVEGRRFLLGVAGPGDMLGLTSALCGDLSGIRAETRYPCRVAAIDRADFLEFIVFHPAACQNVARELSQHYARAGERLRILGLASSATAKLAMLLLEWCRRGQTTPNGIQIRCVLTHGEIGECIGVSRETVTRAMTEFKNQGLVKTRGSALIVTSRGALAI